MTITLAPETEALLRDKAERDGQDVNRLGDALLVYVLQEEARDRTEMLEGIRRGLEASDAGRVRPIAEVSAEMRAKYNLPTHLSDEEIFAGEEGGLSQ